MAIATAVVAVGGVVIARSLATDLPTRPAPAPTSPSPAASPLPPRPPPWRPPTVAAEPRELPLANTPAAATHTAARALFDAAPVLVVAPPPGDPPGAPRDLLARWLAVSLQAPLVHVSPGLEGLVEDLSVRTVVAVGLSDADDRMVRRLVADVRGAFIATGRLRAMPSHHDLAPDLADPVARRARGDPVLLRDTDGPPVDAWLREVRGLVGAARSTPPVELGARGLIVRSKDVSSWAVVTTASVAGVAGAVIDTPDPRAHPEAVDRLGGRTLDLAGTRGAWIDATPATLAWQLETVAAGHALPGGGQTLFPGKLLVALYGHPDGGALGVLGEQPPAEAVTRAREVAAAYAPLTQATVVPAFELIATVASGGAGAAGDYSRRTPVETLRRWVDVAAEAGLYVVLDLQPGRTSFLQQAQEYVELLREPHVGLALDPEWRLGPGQVHLGQIGSVDASEVNAVATWLADLVRAERLPQKLFIVHQFKFSMIRDRHALALGRPELAPVIQMDGQGAQATKDETYRAITMTNPPPNVWWGWKNFYDEDRPHVRSPEATLAVEPTPVFVSYQ